MDLKIRSIISEKVKKGAAQKLRGVRFTIDLGRSNVIKYRELFGDQEIGPRGVLWFLKAVRSEKDGYEQSVAGSCSAN